jgi:hypothetical protein
MSGYISPDYVSVTFGYPTRDSVTVPVAEALQWANDQDIGWIPERAAFRRDGELHETWAKGWWFIGTGELERVGAGAYGDSVIVRAAGSVGPVRRYLKYAEESS